MNTVRIGRLAWIDKASVSPEELFRLRDLFTLFPAEASDFSEGSEPITAYEENSEYFGFPRHAVVEALGQRPATVMDETVLHAKIPFSVLKAPWPQQTPHVDSAVQSLTLCGGAIINAPCGSGKTNMALYVAAKIQQPTLVIVHKGFLMEQWVNRAREVLGVECGIVQQDVCDYKGKHIVVAMLQTLAARQYGPEFYRSFGLIIADECHRASSRTYNEALRQFSGKYRLGLSATLKRGDQLECLFYWHIGPVSSKSTNQQLKGKVYQLFNQVPFNLRKYLWGGKLNLGRLLTDLSKLEDRQWVVVREIKSAFEAGRKILLLSDRKEHLADLEVKLKSVGISDYGYYIGGMKKKDLQASSEKAIILGTYGMAQEGLDIPMLDTAILATPKSEVEQSVGRILRAANGKKEPLVIDVVDSVPILYNMGKKRARLYEKIEFTVNKIGFPSPTI